MTFYKAVKLHIGSVVDLSIYLPDSSTALSAQVTVSRIDSAAGKNVFADSAGGSLTIADSGDRQSLARYLFHESLKKVVSIPNA